MPVNALAALSSSFKKNVRFRRDLGVGSNFFDSPGYCCCSYMTGMLLRIQESMNSYLKLPKQSATLWWHNHRKSSFYRHPSKGCTHYCLPLSTPAKMCSKSTGQKTKTAISLGEFLVIITKRVQPCLCGKKRERLVSSFLSSSSLWCQDQKWVHQNNKCKFKNIFFFRHRNLLETYIIS